MFCPHCGTEVKEGHKFCAHCGAKVQMTPEKKKEAPPPASPKQAASAPKPAAAPAPAVPPKPPIDVKNIIKNPPKTMAVEAALDFKAAEHTLVNDGLKTQAFAGLFSRPQPSEVRVDSLTLVYEPVHMVRAVYEGTFEVTKDFNLALDPDTVKVELAGKAHEVKPTAGGGLFGGASNTLKLTGTETIKKRNEKAVYYDMNGVRKDHIGNHVKGKKTVAFDPHKDRARTAVLGTKFDASDLTDLVLTPDIVQRMQTANKLLDERITVDVQTIYYPKYKATVTNLKSNEQRNLVFSGVDKQVLPSEHF